MKIKQRYIKELREWNWDDIKSSATQELADDDESGQEVGRCWLGSCLSLAPSGKYYLPWACSNLDPCPRCKGTGSAKKADPCEWCKGTGRRAVGEFAAARGVNIEEATKYLEDVSSKIDEATMTFACFACNGEGSVHKDCSWCGGGGSREAHLDQQWYEALDDVAGEHGMYIESGEGDATDLFAVVVVEDVDEEEDGVCLASTV